jgi:hypothetical protein
LRPVSGPTAPSRGRERPAIITIEEERDLGDRAFWRVRQPGHSASGVESAYSSSWLVTARQGKVIMIEFSIDDAPLRADLGVTSDT